MFSFFIVLGQAIFMLGIDYKKFWLMIVGRALFGIGLETLCVIQSTYATRWFVDQEISLAIGLSLALPNVFSSLSGIIMPRVFESTKDLGYVLSLGLYSTVLSFIAGVALVILDNTAIKHD